MMEYKFDVNFRIISIIILFSIGLSLIVNLISTSNIPLIRSEIMVSIEYDSLYQSTIDQNENMLRGITLSDALNFYTTRKAYFVDARDQWEFADGHIPGAINIPEFSFDPQDSLVKSLNKKMLYIVYCDGDDCDLSKRLGNELMKSGFENLFVYIGGFNEWQENQLPIKRESSDE